jgi:nitrile hydratase
MDGIHDMGGMDGFGKVAPETDEPVFHQSWEGRVLAMNRVMGGAGVWNIDMGRFGIELLPPALYLASSYYQKWFLRLERMAVQHGLVDADEIAAGHALRPGKTLKRGTFTVADVEPALRRGAFGRPEQAVARFGPGDRVRARNIHPASHTRLPRYVRGHVGVVERLHGAHVFPDAVVEGRGEDPQWLYTVCFEARELWGDDADPTVKISIDAFEPYLELA